MQVLSLPGSAGFTPADGPVSAARMAPHVGEPERFPVIDPRLRPEVEAAHAAIRRQRAAERERLVAASYEQEERTSRGERVEAVEVLRDYPRP